MMEQPIRIGSLTIKNRIVFPPIATFGKGRPDNTVSKKHLLHYSQIAKGGAGLLVVEACGVSKGIRDNRDLIGLWDDAFLPGLTQLADTCKQNNTVSIVQIIHQGFDRLSYGSCEKTPDTVMEVILNDFIAAAVRCQAAGFDGVELHGAHGFLLNQMVYGGLTSRVCDLIRAVRKIVGCEFIVGIRMGCNTPDIRTGMMNAQQFEAAGVDYLNVSNGKGAAYDVPSDFPFSDLVYGASRIKSCVTIPVFAVGAVTTAEQAEGILSSGYADCVCIGRAILADPQWYNKSVSGISPVPCLNCKTCLWFKNGDICPARKKTN